MRPKLKDEETEEGEIVNESSKRTRSMEGSAIAPNKRTKTSLTNGSDDGPLPPGWKKGIQ